MDASACSFDLLVKIEASDNIPKLRNKLIKYFQSKKSHGGDCQVEYENGSGTAVLRFRTREVRQRVLEKPVHELILDKGVLRLTVCLPTDEKSAEEVPPDNLNKTRNNDQMEIHHRPSVKRKTEPDEATGKAIAPKKHAFADVAVNSKQPSADGRTPAAETKTKAESGDDQSADEELCSTSAVLGDIPLNLNKEFLEMMVENILKDSDSSNVTRNWSVEVIPAISSAVVTFQSGQENMHFLARCPNHRTFKNKGLSVRPLEVTAQVTIEGAQNVDEELLLLYFENEGGEVENIVVNEEEQSAVITFKTSKAVHRILKKKHHIKQEAIKVYPFYKCLGTALYGENKPALTLPAALSESIDHAVSGYLSGNPKAVETIQSDLAKHFCKLDFKQSTVHLIPLPSLLQQKAKDIKEWKDTVRTAFAQALSRFKSQKFHPEADAWEECEEKIREVLLKECVGVVPDQANGVLSVVGLVADVDRLEQRLRDVLNKIAKRVQRETLSVTHEIGVSQSIFHILRQDGLQDKLQQKYPEVKMSYKNESQELIVNGLKDEVFGVNKVVLNGVMMLKRQNLEMDHFVLEFLKGEQQNDITMALLTSSRINAALEISVERVQLLAVSEQDLNDAEAHLKRLLNSEYIDVKDGNVLKMPEWQHLVLHLESANNDSSKKILIQTKGQQVVVSGYKDSVEKVSRELDDFLQQNAEIEETVEVKPNIIVKYIKKNDSSWLEQVKDKVVVSFGNEAIYLSGSRANVTDCKSFFEDLVSSVFFESLNVSKSGVKKFFQDKQSIYVSLIMNETGCLVQLVDQTGNGQDDSTLRQLPKPVYQFQTSDGVEITVYKGDMCSFPVHAVVNSATKNLKLQSGLSKALLDAAGPQLQDECDRLINLGGQLKPGDCVITGAGGRLSCKKIIHAVGPSYDQNNAHKAVAQLRRTVARILDLAQKYNCDSVALPAISKNQGFPLTLCASTIIKAVKAHCDGADDDNTLKRIHLVNNEDSVVQAMEAAVRQEFGNHGDTRSQHVHSTQVTQPPPPVSHVAPDPNILNQVLTKEGVDITLMKGNIEKATTDVTVNAVGEDLALNRGAISNAIFSAAGHKLQQLVNQKQTSGNLGDLIVTEGCELSCQIFHAVAPRWDNGQGKAEKILTGIFKDCLGQAEASHLTSITFPAIGTGNLGFPKALVASLMLDEIVKFSTKKQPKHLKKVVIVLYPSDLQTMQEFSDEFKKKFTSASGGPVPTTSSLKSGPFSKIISSSGKHETKMGSVGIQVVTGDITKETTDVIVNSSNDDFSLKSGVSKAILDAAGQAVEAECQTLASQAKQAMIMTQAGNLKCKKILHLAGQTDSKKIHMAVKDALQMCVKDSHTSISFPAIGTGQGNAQVTQVADAMLDAVVDFLNQNTSSSLKMIRIVIFQQPMLKDFYSSMQQKEATDPKDKAGIWERMQNFGSKVMWESADKLPKGDFVIEGQKVDPACFHICGASQAKVDSAKQQINDLTAQEHNSVCITSNTILSFSAADQQDIVDLQKTMGVSIRIESKNFQASVTIDGLNKDVQKASDEIHKMLQKVRDEDELKKGAELAATVVDWQYQQQGQNFQSFDSVTNYQLEQAREKNLPQVKVTVQGRDYTVTVPDGPATDNQGNTLQIQRIDKLKAQQTGLPECWDPMPGKSTFHVVTIQPGTAEHNEVLNLFQATCLKTVHKIERIQNEVLWRGLQVKKYDMEQRNGHQNNEKRLFHGTCATTIEDISKLGFNRAYAGKNATCYGKGTYFAVNASYSAGDTYSKPDAQGLKFMYLCRVLTGDFTTGTSGIIVPPAKGSNSGELYDSVVDNPTRPTMFIIFNDFQACPEYLIAFK